jgi:hypothetical protein
MSIAATTPALTGGYLAPPPLAGEGFAAARSRIDSAPLTLRPAP